MDDYVPMFLITLLVLVISAFGGCATGELNIKAQAVAAGAACYEAPPEGGTSQFRWNCKKPEAK